MLRVLVAPALAARVSQRAVRHSPAFRGLQTTAFVCNNEKPFAQDPVSPLDATEPKSPEEPIVVTPPVEVTKPARESHEMTPDEIKAERKARKELKKKRKAAKNTVSVEEDPVEMKKRKRREKKASSEPYAGDGSEIDPKDENLDDNVIMERLQRMFEEENDCNLVKLRHVFDKEKRDLGSLLPSVRYWDDHKVPVNPYFMIRFNQAFSKWAGADLRRLSNEEYQDKKYNTMARMFGTEQYFQIFPEVMKKFAPTINLLAEFNDPIARDILTYFGNIIPAQFTENKPKISFRGVHKSLYTLMLVDGKTPGNVEEYGASIQWMVTDIPHTGNMSEGNEVVEYLPPTPLKGHAPHRLVFVLFRQRFGKLEGDIQKISAQQLHEREPFNVDEFALQHHLLPRGLTYFNCQYDLSVGPRYEKLGYGEPQFISEDHIHRKAARKQRKDATKDATSKKWTWALPEEAPKELAAKE